MITLLSNDIPPYPPAASRIPAVHTSDSTLPLPHQPSGRRLPNASLVADAGGTAGGTFNDTVVNVQLCMYCQCEAPNVSKLAGY